MTDWEYHIEELKEAIRANHGSEPEYVETVPVKETFQGQTVWEGEVEVFRIEGPWATDTCYAWDYHTENGKRYITVLKMPPVESPITAVRAAIRGDAENK